MKKINTHKKNIKSFIFNYCSSPAEDNKKDSRIQPFFFARLPFSAKYLHNHPNFFNPIIFQQNNSVKFYIMIKANFLNLIYLRSLKIVCKEQYKDR
jgi:hypothetical protein